MKRIPHNLSSLPYGYGLSWDIRQAGGASRRKLGMIERRESWSVGITRSKMNLHESDSKMPIAMLKTFPQHNT